jgi:hypothetical protein
MELAGGYEIHQTGCVSPLRFDANYTTLFTTDSACQMFIFASVQMENLAEFAQNVLK